MPTNRPNKSVIFALLATSFWGTGNLAIKYVVQSIPPVTLSGVRAMTGGLIVLLYLYFRRKPTRLHWQDIIRIAPLGLIQPAITQTSFFIGIQETDLGLASIIISSAPIQVAMIEYFLFPAERLHPKKLLGLVIGFLGIGVLVWPQISVARSTGNWSFLLIIVAAIAFAVSTIMGRQLNKQIDAPVIAGLSLFVGSLPALLFGLILEDLSSIIISWALLLNFLYIVIFVTAGAYLLWYQALGQNTAGRVGTFLFLIPIWGVVLGGVVLKEDLTVNIFLGGALVIFAIVQVAMNDLPPRAMDTKS